MKKLSYKPKLLFLLLIAGISFTAILFGCSSSTTEDFLPNVSLSVPALNFTATVGLSELQTVTISNLSNQNTSIERVTSTNEVFQVGGYSIDGILVPLETPFTIEGSGSRTVWIEFFPTEVATYQGKLVVESVDINRNRETDLVDLSGVGLPDGSTTTTMTTGTTTTTF